MEEIKKRPPENHHLSAHSATSKKPKPPSPPHAPPNNTSNINTTAIDNDDDAVAAEAADEELSKLLDAPPFPTEQFKVRFLPYPYVLPPAPFAPSSSYITINGNDESCGSSFSDSDSSFMASVGPVGFNIVEPLELWWWAEGGGGEIGGAWGADEKVARGGEDGDDDDGDFGDWEEVLLAAAGFLGDEKK